MKLTRNEFKDLFNNIGMPDIADKMSVGLSDGARVIKQYDYFAKNFGKSFIESKTGKNCRKVMIELATKSLGLANEKSFTYKQLQEIAKLSRCEVVDVMSFLRYGR